MTARPLYTKSKNAEVSEYERHPTPDLIEKPKKMKLYTTTGTVKLRERCNDLDVGLLMCNHWRNPDQWSYFAIDNGCYSAYAQGKEWNSGTFMSILHKVKESGRRPDFVVIPDIVAGGKESLKKSERWGEFLSIEFPEFPLYLAVQDGMEIEDVYNSPILWIINGIFIGGTMEWKLDNIRKWSEFAHEEGLKCHVGRIGPLDRMQQAKMEGADSIDSTSWVQNKGWVESRLAEYRKWECEV